ncbi:MAG: NAD(P)/FAD-dependent oxidoreductase [Polyangiaceae bacterium]
MKQHDAILLGTSPNALCAAIVLGRAGLSVLVLDAASHVGGPVATEAFHPGFLADTGVPSAALDPALSEQLAITTPALRRVSFTALGERTATHREIALPPAFHDGVSLLRAAYGAPAPAVPAPSEADGPVLDALLAELRGLAPRSLRDPALSAAPLSIASAALPAAAARSMREVIRLLFLSIRDFVREAELSHAAGLLGTIAMRSRSAGPFDEGTLFGLLHHTAIHDGLTPGAARGGLAEVPRVLADVARAANVDVRTSVPGPLRIEVTDGVARGVRLPSGELLAASRVLSDHDARTTFTRLVSPADLPPEFNRTVRRVRYRGNAARVHLALDRLPTFPDLPPEALAGTLFVAADLPSIERAWDAQKRGALPARPPVEIAIPTLLDPSLAPDGKHVLSATVQYVPTACADSASVLRAVLDSLAPFAPDLASLVVGSAVSLPRDIESRFGLTEGHLFGGEVTLSQSFFLRPYPGATRADQPIENVHLCGSASHPAGYSGLAGAILARRLLASG